MNAAAKYINQSNFFHGHLASMKISFSSTLQVGLIIAVLLSAISVIYVTNMQRLTVSKLEMVEQKTYFMQMQWGKLLLEKASLASSSRVEELASEKLDMVLPLRKDIIVLRLTQ